jgi:hypothetical protein
MPICIASLLIFFAFVIVLTTCMPAHAVTTSIPNPRPIKTAPASTPKWVAFTLDNTIAYLSHKSFQRGEFVRGDTCLKNKGATWVILTETSEDNVDRAQSRLKWVAPNKMNARRYRGKDGASAGCVKSRTSY